MIKKFFRILIFAAMGFLFFSNCGGDNEYGADEYPSAPLDVADVTDDDSRDVDSLDVSAGGERVQPPPCESLAYVTSLEMARLLGNGINLGNTMEAVNSANRVPNQHTSVFETMWGNPITTQEMITGMRNAGFNTLRIPVAWTNAMDFENGDLTIGIDYLERVETIVNYALNEDMFVIVNAHWDHGWWSMFGHPEEERRDFAHEIFVAMWTQIGEHFQDYDMRLILEPSNEEWGSRFNDATAFSPGGILSVSENYQLLTYLSQTFVDLIRSQGGYNPDRFLLMKGYNTDVMMTLDPRFVLPTDSRGRLLLSVHYYTPWSFTGDVSGVDHWGSVSEVEEMNDLLGRLTRFTEMGYGIVLGEWGVLDNDGPDRLKFFTNFLDLSDYHGFAPTLWDRGAGGMFDRRFTHTLTEPDILELFQSRSVSARADMSTADIISAARESMENTLEAAANRPETIIPDDMAVAWIMFASTDWSIQYSVGDRYQPESITSGVVATDVEITGEGTYTVALNFANAPGGGASGITFAALGIFNGESLFPGYYINITSILVNGAEAEQIGVPFTTSDDGNTTRVNLYNGWVAGIPAGARVFQDEDENANPRLLANYAGSRIHSLEVTFDFVAP